MGARRRHGLYVVFAEERDHTVRRMRKDRVVIADDSHYLAARFLHAAFEIVAHAQAAVTPQVADPRIGELGKKADCLVQTVRFYESEGLLPEPARSEGNFRLYDEVHLQRLLFIRRCRAKDMTLDEIRQLLNLRDRPELGCGEVNALVDAHIAQVRTKMKELRALERELMDLRRSCDSARTSRECGILNSLAEPA